MGFLDGIFSFHVAICAVEQRVDATLRFKLPRHELEDVVFFYAKVLAYLHSYSADLAIVPETRNSEALVACIPVTSLNYTGHEQSQNFVRSLFVGAPSTKTLRSYARLSQQPVRGYLYDPLQIATICESLRGSTSNWISSIEFLYLNPEVIAALLEEEKGKMKIDLTILDGNHLFLNANGRDLETKIRPIDIWSEFQRSVNVVG